MKRYFPRVAEFASSGVDLVRDSLSGPDGIEARQQLARERVVAAAEVKVLYDRLRWCYHASGVNHHEDCKPIVAEVMARIKAPYWNAPGAPAREK